MDLSKLFLFWFAASFAVAQTDLPQTRSLLGQDLYSPPLDTGVRERLEANLERAQRSLRTDPRSHRGLVWLGRRTAYLGHYRQAADIFSDALELYPDSPELLRHRGHRWITLRQFDQAVADLERAAEMTRGQRDRIEPDGAPNRLLLPTSTLQTNIWYHLGLAHYLKGEFEEARQAYRECLKRSTNDDMVAATAHWLYMTLRRLGDDEGATQLLESIPAELHIIENDAYRDLLLLYRGLLKVEDLLQQGSSELQSATLGYGVGNWHLYNGREDEARAIFQEILKLQGWAAFGYIAAEAEEFRRK